MPSNLPTGEEPRKGFEALAQAKTGDAIRVHGTFLSQLATSELHELEALRRKSFERAREHYIGLSNEPQSFEVECNIIDGKSASDKMLFRAWWGHDLVGYALLVIGYPANGQWLIQHMIIDPDIRLQGVGTALIDAVEHYAQDAALPSNHMFAIPLQKSGIDFWEQRGYHPCSTPQVVRVDMLDHEVNVFQKELSVGEDA
jgi:GNAT superfamily N-acetyltransferase